MRPLLFVLMSVMALSACQPTVKIEAPDKPIVINMNVNISHEVRIRVEKDLERGVFAKDSPLF